MDGCAAKWRRNVAENFNRLSRVRERYTLRQTDDREIPERNRSHVRAEGTSVQFRRDLQVTR